MRAAPGYPSRLRRRAACSRGRMAPETAPRSVLSRRAPSSLFSVPVLSIARQRSGRKAGDRLARTLVQSPRTLFPRSKTRWRRWSEADPGTNTPRRPVTARGGRRGAGRGADSFLACLLLCPADPKRSGVRLHGGTDWLVRFSNQRVSTTISAGFTTGGEIPIRGAVRPGLEFVSCPRVVSSPVSATTSVLPCA